MVDADDTPKFKVTNKNGQNSQPCTFGWGCAASDVVNLKDTTNDIEVYYSHAALADEKDEWFSATVEDGRKTSRVMYVHLVDWYASKLHDHYTKVVDQTSRMICCKMQSCIFDNDALGHIG